MLDPAFVQQINDRMVCLTYTILSDTLRPWRPGVFQDPPDFKGDVVRGNGRGISPHFVHELEGKPISQDLLMG